jgi:hypothetical protein
MPEIKWLSVKPLALDLANYRTVRQENELSAIEAIIATSPDRFWALTQSLLIDGYLPTESVIVLRTGPGGKKHTVKEGNRRVAALKLLHGWVSSKKLSVPAEMVETIKKVPSAWRKTNREVPCTIYDESESATVDRIVTLAHGKGEKAGRDQWNAVARARHNRDANNASEPALDLLEKYLEIGKNITDMQRSRWAGEYPLTVLEEAVKRLAPRVGLTSSTALANAYPKLTHRDPLEAVLLGIGLKEIGFDDIRSKEADFAAPYGFPTTTQSGGGGATGSSGNASTSSAETTDGSGGSAGGASSSGSKRQTEKKTKAAAVADPKSVRRHLKAFTPRGKGREKVVTLKTEAARLDVGRTPLAFSFVLRSMFEISAKAFCSDHASAGLTAKKPDGSDRPLADVLREIVKHLTKNNQDKEMVKALHGAMTELGKHDGLLSVTSLNQLVHNPKFLIAPADVAIRFGNVFPLLEEMNR